jgi:hypothetical protein
LVEMARATGLDPATFDVTGRSKSNEINRRCNLFGGRNRSKTAESLQPPPGKPSHPITWLILKPGTSGTGAAAVVPFISQTIVLPLTLEAHAPF